MPVTLEEYDEVERRASALMGLISAATAELVELLADVLDRDVWHGFGIKSPEHWAAVRFGVSAAHASRLVAAAQGLRELPKTRAAFAAGEITEDHVAAIVCAGVTSVHDVQVVGLAQVATVSQLRKGLSFLPKPPAEVEAEPEQAPAPEPDPVERPSVSFGFRDDGMWGIHGRLLPEDGELVQKALFAARDAEFRARYGDKIDPTERDDVSWTDALIRLAHGALDGLDPDTKAGRPPGDRYQVIIHLDPDTGAAQYHLGPSVDRLSRRQICCDAMIRISTVAADGSVNLGHRGRVVDPKLRMVVERRDGGCAVPGCTATHWLTIHHLWHWEDGGPTDTWNLITLCPAHHRAIHRSEYRIEGNPDHPETLQFIDARGSPIGLRPPTPPGQPSADAAATLGITPPRYQPRSGERADWNYMVWREHPKIGAG